MIEDVRRAREFYRYLEPGPLLATSNSILQSNSSPNEAPPPPDLLHSLVPFVQLAALQSHAQRALLNVTDRDTQYFLAEASCGVPEPSKRQIFEQDEDLLFAGREAVPKKGTICETTIRLQPTSSGTYPFFTVPDLSKDLRYAEMAIVKGPPYFKFYAGTPLTTRNRINIGSLCVMDTEVRQSLTEEEQRSLGSLAAHVISYLEINRGALEGRRAKRMSDSLNHFIEGKSSYSEPSAASKRTGETNSRKPHKQTDLDVRNSDSELAGSSSEDGNSVGGEGIHKRQNENNLEAVSHEKVFGRAANLLREAFHLNDGGGVMFVGAGGTLKHVHDGNVALHIATGTQSPNGEDQTWPLASPTHQISTTTTFDPILNAFAKSPEHPAPLLALSTQEVPFAPADLLGGTKGTTPLQVDEEILHELFNRYPRGRIWIIDESGLMSASDEEHNPDRHLSHKEAIKQANTSTWNRGEPTLLREAFPGVRQLMFAPNWNAEISDWTSGCFVWSRNETRVLTSSTDLSFLNSFIQTVMAELSHLDTMLADKQKNDFIGSISHELRSPLHGILASAEFLLETATTSFQQNLINTVDSCGRTLLDTINHILDYSKINSFERNWRPKVKSRKARDGSLAKTFEKPLPSGAPPLLKIYDVTDVAAITEEVVEGIAVGQIYSHRADITDVTPQNRGRVAGKGLFAEHHKVGGRGEGPGTLEEQMEIIIDIDHEDWLFITQPGALRRVVLNLVGNATKYTTRGTIKVRLQLENLEEADSGAEMLVLTVTDTGCGISPAFLSSKLFLPFAQENPLMPGTGLGLSIVRSIVTMLGGSVDLRSRLGHGTTVEVRLPLQRPLPGPLSSPIRSGITQLTDDSTDPCSPKDDSIRLLQGIAKGCKVAIYGLSDDTGFDNKRDSSRILARYLTDWFGIDLVALQGGAVPDVVLVEERDVRLLMASKPFLGTGFRPALLIVCINATRHNEAQAEDSEAQDESIIEFVSKPCGPYKLAKALQDCIVRLKASTSENARTNKSNRVSPFPPLRPNGLSHRLEELTLEHSDTTHPGTGPQTNGVHSASQLKENAQMAVDRASTCGADAGGEQTSFPFPETERNGDTRSWIETPVSPTSMYLEAQNEPLSVFQGPSPGDISVRPPNSPRVLLVDDNEINLSLLKAFMQKRKYDRVDLAENGLIALNAIKAATEPYDVIFMDISMPVMNGFEATRAIRQHESRSMPCSAAMIIALTGLASGRDQSEGFLAGFDIYMAKPVSFKEIGKLLDIWEAKRRGDLEEYDTPV